jgi:hypothetical protein
MSAPAHPPTANAAPASRTPATTAALRVLPSPPIQDASPRAVVDDAHAAAAHDVVAGDWRAQARRERQRRS